MAKAKVKPEKQIPPDAPEAIEAARVAADMTQAAEVSAEKKEQRDEQTNIDNEVIKSRQDEEKQKAADLRDRREKAREEELKKPLSNEEMVEYHNLVTLAQSGKPVDVASMRRLADFRTRLKNNGVKNPQ